MYIQGAQVILPEKVSLNMLVDNGEKSALERSNKPQVMGFGHIRTDLGKRAEDYPLTEEVLDRFKILGRRPTDIFHNKAETGVFTQETGMDSVYISSTVNASDMAQTAVEQLKAKLTADNTWSDPTYIIYCHATPEDDMRLVPSFRIQHVLGNTQTIPFGIAQCDSASAFYGLSVASDLLSNSKNVSVLLVTADYYQSPVPRRIGDFTLHSDAAAAVLLTSEKSSNNLRLRKVITQPVDGKTNIYAMDAREFDQYNHRLKVAVIDSISKILKETGISVNDIDCVVPQVINKNFVDDVHQDCLLGQIDAVAYSSTEVFNLSTTTPLAGLSLIPEDAKHILLWGIGLNGCVASAVVSR